MLSNACIDKIYSVSVVMGNLNCNAKCSFCAGKTLNKHPFSEKLKNQHFRNIETAIKLSARYGGWSLSITSAGEPTCDPELLTEILEVYASCKRDGAYMPNVNVFTNGILLADKDFCDKWLPKWRELGLTNFAISIHDLKLKDNAEVYGIETYPAYGEIIKNVQKHGIGVRATLLLQRGHIETSSDYKNAIKGLINWGFNNITSWAIGNSDGSRNKYTPSRLNLLLIKMWLKLNATLTHGHVWGGGVYDYNDVLLRVTDYVTPHNRKKNYVRQLVVLYGDGIYYSWIKKGAICQK